MLSCLLSLTFYRGRDLTNYLSTFCKSTIFIVWYCVILELVKGFISIVLFLYTADIISRAKRALNSLILALFGLFWVLIVLFLAVFCIVVFYIAVLSFIYVGTTLFL